MVAGCDHAAKRDAEGKLYCMYCLVPLNWDHHHTYGSQALDVVRAENDVNSDWHVVSITEHGHPVLLRLSSAGARDLRNGLDRILPRRSWFRR